MAAGGGLAHLWKKWEIQILVLLSFTLQLILLGFARIRRHKGSAVLRILLWLAYLMADSTAIYTLGHLSLRSRSSESELIAFWAPFLLLHLGGPDTITAYALEDNQLWLRHLLTLVVQVLGAAYVLYQSFTSFSHGGRLVYASLLMFVTGFLKYGERTWALKCANIDSINKSLDVGDDEGRRQPYDGRGATTRRKLDEEEVLLGAHYTFNVCKSHFADSLMTSLPELTAVDQGIHFNGAKYVYELIEMHLSLMYDILYTKAAVIHTWYGWCIRVVSPLATFSAFFLFQLSTSARDDDDYSKVDSAVTYVLLVGAFAVEMASLFRAVGSSWTCALLYAHRWDKLRGALVRLRRPFLAASSRRWLYSLGQYNLLDFCTRDRTELRSRITKKVGLEKWWNKLHHSGTTEISQTTVDFVLQAIPRRGLGDMNNARGRWILEHINPELYNEISWSVDDADFDQSILIWHVVTDVYLCCRGQPAPAAAGGHHHQAGLENADQLLARTVKELSDYMMFLYVVHPYMLPGPVRTSRYDNNCHGLVALWDQQPDVQRTLTPRENLATYILNKYRDDDTDDNTSHDEEAGSSNQTAEENNPHGLAYISGACLAGMLLSDDDAARWRIPDVLQMIAEVWIEILCYAARHCNEVSHSKQLSSGGELLTAIGLLVEYNGRFNFHRNDGAPAVLISQATVSGAHTSSGTASEVYVDLGNISSAAAAGGEIREGP